MEMRCLEENLAHRGILCKLFRTRALPGAGDSTCMVFPGPCRGSSWLTTSCPFACQDRKTDIYRGYIRLGARNSSGRMFTWRMSLWLQLNALGTNSTDPEGTCYFNDEQYQDPIRVHSLVTGNLGDPIRRGWELSFCRSAHLRFRSPVTLAWISDAGIKSKNKLMRHSEPAGRKESRSWEFLVCNPSRAFL